MIGQQWRTFNFLNVILTLWINPLALHGALSFSKRTENKVQTSLETWDVIWCDVRIQTLPAVPSLDLLQVNGKGTILGDHTTELQISLIAEQFLLFQKYYGTACDPVSLLPPRESLPAPAPVYVIVYCLREFVTWYISISSNRQYETARSNNCQLTQVLVLNSTHTNHFTSSVKYICNKLPENIDYDTFLPISQKVKYPGKQTNIFSKYLFSMISQSSVCWEVYLCSCD